MYITVNNNKIIVKEANTFFSKLMGFMFKKNFNYGLLFKKTNSIHTFFMKEKIDVIGLDENNAIIYLKRNVPKNRILIINNKIKKTSILELPNNTSSSLKIGDKLTFISE